MAISGDLKVSATLSSYHIHHPVRRSSLPSSSKVNFAFLQSGGGPKFNGIIPKWPCVELDNSKLRGGGGGGGSGAARRTSMVAGAFKLSADSISQEAETFLLNAINMNFLERLNLAWKIVFPSKTTRRSSNAMIAKQRLKMILFSDRCAVSDEAKQKIVTNVIHALSDFVEIESQDKVQLTVTTDTDVGTVYSVTVPVRRVKQEYQDAEDFGSIMNVEYKDKGEGSGSVDVTFDFFVPDENASSF